MPMETLSEDSSAKDLFSRAMKWGTLEEVQGMVRLGADVNWRDDEKGFSGLLIAAAHGREKKLEFLLSKGADVNLAGKKGWTPLMLACANGQPAMVERY